MNKLYYISNQEKEKYKELYEYLSQHFENFHELSSEEYKQYHDYILKDTIQKRANGVLKFLGIPYKIKNIILSEIASRGPKLHRLDFAGEAENDGEEICIILEFQSRLPTDEDVKRFFQYVSSLRILKNKKVKLYILCTKKASYTKREFELDDGCVYEMQVISLKDYKASEIIKNIEDKINHQEEIADEDIVALQLIAYTEYSEPTVELLTKATKLVAKLPIDENEKEAVLYIFDVLNSNMLNDEEREQLLEVTKMLNPRYEYQRNEGKLDVAKKLLEDGMPIEKIMELTGFEKSKILNAK